MAHSEQTRIHERRAVERTDFRCPVSIHLDGKIIRGQLVNLSATGALIALPCVLTLGTEIRMDIELPDGQAPLELFAMAIRRTSQSPARFGMTFILPPHDAVARIRAMIYDSR